MPVDWCGDGRRSRLHDWCLMASLKAISLVNRRTPSLVAWPLPGAQSGGAAGRFGSVRSRSGGPASTGKLTFDMSSAEPAVRWKQFRPEAVSRPARKLNLHEPALWPWSVLRRFSWRLRPKPTSSKVAQALLVSPGMASGWNANSRTLNLFVAGTHPPRLSSIVAWRAAERNRSSISRKCT
jgi:hypothetical protein